MSDSLEEEIRVLRARYWSERDPEGRAFAPLADAYRRLGDLSEALALLKDGLGRHPEFTSGHLVAARVARARGDLVVTREHLDRVLDLDPYHVTALVDRAEVLLEEGDAEGGLLDLRAALDLDPTLEGVRDRLRELEELAVASAIADALEEEGATEEPSGPPLEGPFAVEPVPIESLAPDPIVGVDTAEPGPVDGDRERVDAAVEPITEEPAWDEPPSTEVASPEVEPTEIEPAAIEAGSAGGETGSLEAPAFAATGGTPDDREDPEVRGEDPEGEEDGFLLTRTLGDLYAKQGLRERAIDVYERLVARSPSDRVLQERLAELRHRLETEDRPATEPHPPKEAARADPLPADELPAAGLPVDGPRGEGRAVAEAEPESSRLAVRTIRQEVADLLAWVPGAVPVAALAPDPDAPAGAEIGVRDDVEPGQGGEGVGPSGGAARGGAAVAEGEDEDEGDAFEDWLRSLQS